MPKLFFTSLVKIELNDDSLYNGIPLPFNNKKN